MEIDINISLLFGCDTERCGGIVIRCRLIERLYTVIYIVGESVYVVIADI